MEDRSTATAGSTHRTQVERPTPARRLIAASIKRGPAAWRIEQPAMSAADKAAHAAATHVRRRPSAA
ncbi:hypothetical protein [Streptomyces sp. H27-H5]|uniref:hypothetical protein n=1 Tax=Streptomyces sp. H27-H5 TaxID=2996460 RepID=UPI0022716A2D|nr:hypothetical protein [Streptomyces sp. H27-H5]MCY0959953.1 hypothetical protein [Streptomyces sp. H27-H5]